MTSWLQFGTAVVAVIVGTPVLLWTCFPEFVFNLSVKSSVWLAGLRPRKIRVKDTEYAYLVGGNPTGETVIMLHGFTGRKEGLAPLAKRLCTTHRVIILDHVGHGDTSPRRPGVKHTPDFFVESVHEFAHAVIAAEASTTTTTTSTRPTTQKFHILGTSLGGMISGLYAATYPEDLLSATLLCPAGVNSPNPTKFEREVATEHGRRVLVPHTLEQFEARFLLATHTPIKLSKRMVRFLHERNAPYREWFDKLYEELVQVDAPLEKALHKIKGKVSVLVLWGRSDKLLHWSTTEVFRDKLMLSEGQETSGNGSVDHVGDDGRKKKVEVHVVEECGHMIPQEQPDKVAELWRAFVGGL